MERMNLELEAMLNHQITLEFQSEYAYLAMGSWFARHDQGLPGFSRYFLRSSAEERGHALMIMDYITVRGGNVVFQPIAAPAQMDWDSPHQAIEAALELEMQEYQYLLNIHEAASAKGDGHLTEFLESNYLGDQVRGINQKRLIISQLNRTGSCGVGLHIIDSSMFHSS